MKTTRSVALLLALCLLASLLAGCGQSYTVRLDANFPGAEEPGEISVNSGKTVTAEPPVREGYVFEGWFADENLTQAWDLKTDKVKADLTLYAAWDKDTGDAITEGSGDKDFSRLRTPGSQEEAYDYDLFFLPEVDGSSQPFVGDTMPYYEDGVYYIYYLKEAGDSYNHSAYLVTTTDFLTYTEYDDPVLEANRSGGQDSWIGTGSVVKLDGKYYFFYTGHGSAATLEYAEKVMVAVGDSPFAFEKLEGWEITPPASLGQKNDFRDPQGYVDPETGDIILTVTASQQGTARLLKYTLSPDLQTVTYDGIIFTDPTGSFWNLECSDTFRIGDTWYISYSGQDDTLWYAGSESPYGPYGEAKRLDDKLFYAAKHVEDGDKAYMVGWARRSESVSSTQDVNGWAGNLAVQEIIQLDDGSLILDPVDSVQNSFTARRALAVDGSHIYLESGSRYSYTDAFTCYESFMLTGDFVFTGEGSFGLSFDYNGRTEKNKLIVLDPAADTISLVFNEGSTHITETAAILEPGESYSFTYIQDGSVGIFYLDGQASLTVRLYGVSGKPIQLFAENNAIQFTSLREYTRG
ncbi:MAG: InlB B-repeat-containing protein [Oscillospiraceae bacterium]|nr:InlB B-repeat-containing protein [Oscillospiraceae bacterium]